MEKDLIKQIAREYNTLNYYTELYNIVSVLFPKETLADFSKLQLHKKISNVLTFKHNGEHQLKYSLYKEFFNQDLVAAFEMKVNRSRADFLTINGISQSFEIKSEIDNLQKLKKQSLDYSCVFDYNYVVIHSRHLKRVKEIVPSSFGIWGFDQKRKVIYREAKLNKNIDPEIQLSLLNKNELRKAFYENHEISKEQVLKEYSVIEINNRFKEVLKDRYRQRWEFVIQHKRSILPVDIQFFFNKNIHPSVIYES